MANIQSGYLKTKNGVQLMSTNPYPIGAIYLSVDSTNPSKLFGGKWEQIKDRFLLACGSSYKNNEIGGEASHTLTVSEMPYHTHRYRLNFGAPLSSSTENNHGKIYGAHPTAGWNTSFEVDEGEIIRSTGGDKPHNNMPPYLAIYVWKRIA